MLNAPAIKPHIWENPFKLIYEVRKEAIGAILDQLDDENFNVTHHASSTLNKAHRNYPMAERELFAKIFFCDKIKSCIIDSKVRMDCDGSKKIFERTDVKPRMIH